ncbi:hypothetical protein NIASO_20750 [Niabella soli DSM 19437]|uniref:Uncharacterized protein n=1 Tax=Niabella soli DSM 19437 TaxID=929713 RepID=W0F4W1_9BACT|nr:hypothetical protein NIASO_20750 [Niabella soli DSM 19437]
MLIFIYQFPCHLILMLKQTTNHYYQHIKLGFIRDNVQLREEGAIVIIPAFLQRSHFSLGRQKILASFFCFVRLNIQGVRRPATVRYRGGGRGLFTYGHKKTLQ